MIRLDPAELVVVVGPTASGKTDLALRLAERSRGEIVNADSVQVYRGFDLGSGKPTREELSRVRHHLIDTFDPLEPVDAMRFAAEADRAIEDARARGKIPIVCGGTFLWVRALLYGLANAPPADPEIRARHAAEAESSGRASLHERLKQVDAASAARLSPNDFVRVSRALEVLELTGRPLSEFQSEHGWRTRRYQARLVGVRWSADELSARISARTRAFLAAGWIDEVRSLVDKGYREARAMSSVGYRQVLEHVEGKLPIDALAGAVDRATRVFARRQRTWLRDEDVQWLTHDEARAAVAERK